MSLRKILEESKTMDEAIEQILALIPKERPMTGKDLKCYCDGEGYCNCQFSENEGFNSAIDEITHRLEGV